jgi:SAM-dependent methyltransferase
MNRLLFVFSRIFFDPVQLANKFKAFPIYISNILRYQKSKVKGALSLEFLRLRFYTHEMYSEAGSCSGAYFFQDIWAAQKLYNSQAGLHVDVGSRIDGFIGHILPFCKVEYVDIRPLKSPFNNLVFKEGSILSLPYSDNSVASLSCLHVIEHIGLGRYGDEVDSIGHLKAAKELVRILKPGGKLYIGTPVGKESLFFDAHRVFHVETVVEMFSGLSLESFDFIDDKGTEIKSQVDYSAANANRFGCGLFVFRKK